MYLKRLELFGFKSFAERTHLEFGPGITAVVGPNGSGKSNISDAIRWVLGEQSARALRGARMEDIIFGGSAGKRAMNFAEVSLIIDNASRKMPLDTSEVMITRRVDRAGDSEYFINQVSCRLKDVLDLFMDTGVGKENYSVIGQGRIDEILSAKPEERRSIIEEAAGIVRYKTRKREAQRRLEETEHNLLRLTDLMGALGEQVQTLAEQAEKARIYHDLQGQVAQVEVALLSAQIGSLKRRLGAQVERNERWRAHQQEVEGRLAGSEEALEAARQLAEALESELAVVQGQVLEAATRLEQAQSRLALARQRSLQAGQEEERQAAFLHALGGKREALAAELEALSAQQGDLQARLGAAQARLGEQDGLHARLSVAVADGEKALERVKDQALALLQQAAEARNAVLASEREKEEGARRRARLQAEQESAAGELKGASVALEAARTAAGEAQEGVKAAVTRQAGLRQERQEAAQALQRLAGKMNEARQKLGATSARLNLLSEMQREFEGFQKGPKSVLQAREKGYGWSAGIVGAVAELLRTDARYERAIEVSLGGSLQDIITLTDQDAKSAVEYLKNNDLGRATFLPLSTMRPNPIGERDRRELQRPGIIGVADDLCRYEERLAPAMQFLLGRTVVAENLDSAIALGKATAFRYRAVTLDGELLHPGGAITGGSLRASQATGLLSREREREELTQQVAALKRELETLQGAVRAAEQRQANLEGELAAAGDEIRRLEVESARRQAEVGALEGEVRRLEEVLSAIDGESASLAEEIAAAAARAEERRQAAEALAGARSAAEAEVGRLTEALRDQLAGRDAAARALSDCRVEVASLSEEQRGLAQQVRRLESALADLEGERQRTAAALADARRQQAEAEAAVHMAEAETATAGQARAALEEEQRKKHTRRLEVLAQANDREREIRASRRSLQELGEQLGAGEVEEARLRVEETHLLQRLQEAHGVTYADVEQQALAPDELPEAQQRLARLRQEVQELGPVNLAAIDEHRQASEKLQFLTAQRADLEEAKASLYRAIEELDRRISHHFRESFQQIRREFQSVFAEIFEGGKADLVLVDEANILETGIDIVAQPPGKKMQGLGLLSGGERALTAIALLFALFKVKPSPFCVLDEVEAALDEANVERFGRFLRGFARDSQFVVITHQRGTMEIADALYGVTMEGTGISRLVSVRLTGRDEVRTA